MKTVNLGSRREVFWDDYIIDTDKTTAFHRIMQPKKMEECFKFDQGGELLRPNFLNILKTDEGYNMYYLASRTLNHMPKGPYSAYVAVIQSKDGIHWTRPSLNICTPAEDVEYPQLDVNNIVIEYCLDGMLVFRDENPACPPEELYKIVGLRKLSNEDPKRILAYWISHDGLHFKEGGVITEEGAFDSLNTVIWKDGRYVCYFRSAQPRTQLSPDRENKFRSISVIYSNDFKNWTEPKALEYDDDIEYDLYTNNIIQYERAPHMMIGFPARYFDHNTGWSDNMEQMISGAHKKRAAEISEIRRVGLAITDSIFMCSRDGELWHRYHSAFVDPGYENETNWVYGSNFLAYNFIDSGRENYYFYDIEGPRDFYNPRYLRRYEIRKDGFACIMADGGTMLSDGEKVVVTKPIVFDSNDLHINFSTSAFGYIYVDVLDEDGNPLSDKQSVKIFGSNIDRVVRFNDGSNFTEYKGKAIRLRFRMLDAKLFSMKFE